MNITILRWSFLLWLAVTGLILIATLSGQRINPDTLTVWTQQGTQLYEWQMGVKHGTSMLATTPLSTGVISPDGRYSAQQTIETESDENLAREIETVVLRQRGQSEDIQLAGFEDMRITGLQWEADSRALVIFGRRDSEQLLRIVRVPLTGQNEAQILHEVVNAGNAIGIGPNLQHLYVSNIGAGGRVIALESGTEYVIDDTVSRISWSPDARYLAHTGQRDSSFQLVDLADGRQQNFAIDSFENLVSLRGDIPFINWVSNTQTVLLSAVEGGVYAYNFASGALRQITDVGFLIHESSPDGRYTLLATHDKNPDAQAYSMVYRGSDAISIYVLDIQSGRRHHIHSDKWNRMQNVNFVWSPDSNYLALYRMGAELAIHVFDSRNGRRVRQFTPPRAGYNGVRANFQAPFVLPQWQTAN